MAGDWIKMRTSLLTNPKVNGIAKALETETSVGKALGNNGNIPMSRLVTRNVMRHVTVSSLLVVWGAANEHTKDGVFQNSELEDLDDMTGIPFFGAAMELVGWAVYNEEEKTVTLPNFNEYNTSGSERSAGAKTGAERQKEYRERLKASNRDVTSDVTSDVTDNRREEKRREEEIPLTSAAKLPTCPFQKIVDLYNTTLPELPTAKVLNDKRQRDAKKFWLFVLTSEKSDGTPRATTAEQALEWIAAYFLRARDNDFVMGRTKKSDEHAGWRSDFDYLLSEKGITQVIEKTREAA